MVNHMLMVQAVGQSGRVSTRKATDYSVENVTSIGPIFAVWTDVDGGPQGNISWFVASRERAQEIADLVNAGDPAWTAYKDTGKRYVRAGVVPAVAFLSRWGSGATPGR
jgi:hypothetical protein